MTPTEAAERLKSFEHLTNAMDCIDENDVWLVVDALLDREAKLAKAAEALEFYAQKLPDNDELKDHWREEDIVIMRDPRKARQALQQIGITPNQADTPTDQ